MRLRVKSQSLRWDAGMSALVNWQSVKTPALMFQCGAMISLKLAECARMFGACACAQSVASQRARSKEADGISAKAKAQHRTSDLQANQTRGGEVAWTNIAQWHGDVQYTAGNKSTVKVKQQEHGKSKATRAR
jgi:hypothetical protein